MKKFSWLGLLFLAPAFVIVVLFFLAPVVLTGLFAFTNMSTTTGIKGGDYMLAQNDMRELVANGVDADIVEQLQTAGYVVDEVGLERLAALTNQATAEEFRKLHFGGSFSQKRDIERALNDLKNNRIRSTRDRKQAADLFKQTVLNERFADEVSFRAALESSGIDVAAHDLIVENAYTGWVYTADNIKLLFSLPSTWRYAQNTVIYVLLTLSFNVIFGLFLAVATFYLPAGQAAFFRVVWFLPRILPPVIYVLMWKWFTWDTGFLSTVLSNFGVKPINWMKDTNYHAWTTIVLINGFMGASMGMILFSSAIRAIPTSMLYASEVDGANRWQQVWYIILPQLRWPILFVTAYQTLSLLTSFEYIILSTEGGPGGATEVWALAAYFTALNNYGGNLQYGLGAAFALFLVIIGVLASLFYLRLFNFRDLVAKPLIER